MTCVLNLLLSRLSELETECVYWEPRLNVFDRELHGSIDEILRITPCNLTILESVLRRPGNSFREISDTIIAAACWFWLNSDVSQQRILVETIAPWRGIVTLLGSFSRRLLIWYEATGDIQYVRYALAAINLLGDNADPREEPHFLDRLQAVAQAHGHAGMIGDIIENLSLFTEPEEGR